MVLAGQEWLYTVDAFVDVNCSTRMFIERDLEPGSVTLDGMVCHLSSVSEPPVTFDGFPKAAIVGNIMTDVHHFHFGHLVLNVVGDITEHSSTSFDYDTASVRQRPSYRNSVYLSKQFVFSDTRDFLF